MSMENTSTTSDASSCLRTLVQHELLHNMIRATYAKSKEWMILVLDQRSTRIISSCLTMGDITSEGVSLVENITLKRMPFPDMHVLYFISPTLENIRTLLSDFPNERKSRYSRIHLYFLSRVGDEAMELLKSNPVLLRKIITFQEVNIDFLPIERCTFTLDNSNCLNRLYSPLSLVPVNEEIECISVRLVSVFASLKEYPYVRYKGDKPKMAKLAQVFQRKMNHFVANNVNFKYRGQNSSEDRATLLIFDRSDDLLPLFMHECTYQAIVQDLLMVLPEEIEYQAETNTGTVTKKALLNENDSLWVEFRHSHIADVSQELSRRMHTFAATHAGASLAKGEIEDISIMASALKDLPEYREKLGKLAQHMYIAGKVMEFFSSTKLLDIVQFEQTLATGVDESGKKMKDSQLLKELDRFLQNPDITTKDKTRLLSIFLISQQGSTIQDKKTLVKSAALPAEYEKILHNLRHIGLNPQQQINTPTTSKVTSKKVKAAKEKATTANYSVSRYDPHIKETVMALLDGTLSVDEYPYVIVPPVGVTGGATKTQEKKVQSLRKRTNSKASKEKEETHQEAFQGSRTIVFMAGGASYSELKAMYDLRNEVQRDLIIGTTDMVRPNDFLSSIGRLEDPPELNLSGISLDEISLSSSVTPAAAFVTK